MQIKENRKWSREGEKITWHEGWWLLSSVVAGGGGDGVGDDGFHQFFPCFPYLSLFFPFVLFFLFFFLSRFFPLYPYSASLFFLSIPLYFFPFLFLYFLLLSLSSSVFFFFCYSSLSFFVLFGPLICPLVSCALPCIYKKNRGERDRNTSPPSSPTRGKLRASGGGVGAFLKGSRCLFKERDGGDRGRKIFFFLCFARPEKEEDPRCRSKRHRLGPFFYNNA